MSEKMRAVVKSKEGMGAELMEVEIPKIKDNEVLVKVKATSICGTDVHIYTWDKWSATRIGKKKLPQIMGHEVAGEVVEVGKAVKRIKVGDYISAETHIFTFEDLTAQVGQLNLGDHMEILGVDRDGSFAEYIAIPENVCWKNEESIPPEIASIQEPLGNAVYAVLGEDNDVAGKTLVILGDGPIGLFATAFAKTVGVAKIFLVGLNDFALKLGKSLGADFTLRADEDMDRVEFIREHTYGAGADIVVEMAGAPQAIHEGLKMLRKGGRFSAFGILKEGNISLDYNDDFVFKGIQIHSISGRKIFDTWYRVRNLLATEKLNVKPIITHLYKLEDFKKGFDNMLSFPRKCGKVVLFPDERELLEAQKRMKN